MSEQVKQIDNRSPNDNWIVNVTDMPITVACNQPQAGKFSINLQPGKRQRGAPKIQAQPYLYGKQKYDQFKYELDSSETWEVHMKSGQLVMQMTLENGETATGSVAPASITSKMKRCPFCAEEIQDAAIICKHCGKNLDRSIDEPKNKLLDISKYTSAGLKPILHTHYMAVLRMPKKIDWIWVIVLTFLSFILVGTPIIAYIVYFFMYKKPPMIRLTLTKDGNIDIEGNIDIAQKYLEAQAAKDAITPEERKAASKKKTITLLVVCVGIPLLCVTFIAVAALISSGS